MKSNYIETDAIHSGEKHTKHADALTVPIFQTSTYVFKNMETVEKFTKKEVHHFEYGRYGNPTQKAAEEKIAALEGGDDCLLFASGMAAITTTLLTFLSNGDHIILTDDSYKKTYQFCMEELPRFGIETSVVKMGNYDAIMDAVLPNTKIILTESPTNPYLNVADFAKLLMIKKTLNSRVLLIVDSTFGTPYNQRPLEYGCDLVFHSATKYLSGHNDILAGAVIGNNELVEKIRVFGSSTGAIIAPHCAYLLLRGLKTFPVRIEKQNRSALQVARFLAKQTEVIDKVYYPGLRTHHDYAIAKRQMRGFGGVVTFIIKRPLDKVKQFLDHLKLCHIAPSLGGVETLITHPATVSYYSHTKEYREKIGIVDGLVRLSVGLEHHKDIIYDLSQALQVIK